MRRGIHCRRRGIHCWRRGIHCRRRGISMDIIDSDNPAVRYPPVPPPIGSRSGYIPLSLLRLVPAP
eukprot:6358570-Pyramimonas_sp.AAC.1